MLLEKEKVPEQMLSAFNDPQVLLSPDTMARLQTQFAGYGAQGPAMLQQIIEAMKVGLVVSLDRTVDLIVLALTGKAEQLDLPLEQLGPGAEMTPYPGPLHDFSVAPNEMQGK